MSEFSTQPTPPQPSTMPSSPEPRQMPSSVMPQKKSANGVFLSVVVIIILLLVAGNIFLGYQYYTSWTHLNEVSAVNAKNATILNLEKIFVAKVLKTQGVVSSDDRLALENAVAATNDSDIKTAWTNFLASTTEADAQQKVLVLLNLFANKINY